MHRHHLRNQWILLGVLLIVQGTISDITFPDVISIVSSNPILNETMYADFPNLWSLDMSNQTEFDFPVDQVLLIHDELSRFICNNCGVRYIYQKSMSNLPQLTYLVMENNSLQYIHPDAFEKNARLEKLYLAGNQLTTFNPETTLRHLSVLALLDLSWNEKFDLNKVLLPAARMLFLTCNHCHTTFLNRNSIALMPRLSQLYLSYNAIERIDDDAFTMAKCMKILNVNGNRVLHRLNLISTSLDKLTAEGCSLGGTLDTSNLPLLKHVNVRSNYLERVNEAGFRHNPNIKTILLDDNLIQRFPDSLLELSLNELQRLCLDRNTLQPCSQMDEAKHVYSSRKVRRECLDDSNPSRRFENYLPNINGTAVYKKAPVNVLRNSGETADFSSKSIVFIEPDYLADDQTVTEVLFDNNPSFDFQPFSVFLNSPLVELLSLKNCLITTIYDTTFMQLPNLKYLHLQKNKIQSILSNSLFADNPNLTQVNISHNKLKFLATDVFARHRNLVVINLDWNEHLSNMANTPFLLSTSLQKLSCRHCGFERVDQRTLSGLPNLHELNLEHNSIKTIDANALSQNTQLMSINLQHNHLVFFEPNINHLSHLTQLCLARNTDFDFEHPKNRVLREAIHRMLQLDKGCQGDTFSNTLIQLFNASQKAKKDSQPEARLMQTTSSAARHSTNVALSGLLLNVVFRYWVHRLCVQTDGISRHFSRLSETTSLQQMAAGSGA